MNSPENSGDESRFEVKSEGGHSVSNSGAYRLTAHHIAAIEGVLAKGGRAEIIPGPNGAVKILDIRRKVVKDGSFPCRECMAFQQCKKIYLADGVAKCIHWNSLIHTVEQPHHCAEAPV